MSVGSLVVSENVRSIITGSLAMYSLNGHDDSDKESNGHVRDTVLPVNGTLISPQLHVSYFRAGTSFSGTQRVITDDGGTEEWNVSVLLRAVDLAERTISGVMSASNISHLNHTVKTTFDGEIVDNKRYQFLTGQWGASKHVDLEHWTHFGSFSSVKSAALCNESLNLTKEDHLYMRWKERFFLDTSDIHASGLTIAGFYYVCFRRSDGLIRGLYYDKNSTPYQCLELRVDKGSHGMAFGESELV